MRSNVAIYLHIDIEMRIERLSRGLHSAISTTAYKWVTAIYFMLNLRLYIFLPSNYIVNVKCNIVFIFYIIITYNSRKYIKLWLFWLLCKSILDYYN